MSRVKQKRVLRVILIKIFLFLFPWYALFKEILSEIAVKIRFLWNSKHGVYGAASFIAIVTSCYLRKDMRKFASVILYMNIICIAQLVCDANLKFCTFPVRILDVISIVNQHALSGNTWRLFLPRKYDVISQLRHGYAKDPLCVTWLIYQLHNIFEKRLTLMLSKRCESTAVERRTWLLVTSGTNRSPAVTLSSWNTNKRLLLDTSFLILNWMNNIAHMCIFGYWTLICDPLQN